MEAMEHGAFRYLTKPIDASELTVVERAACVHQLARVRRESSDQSKENDWR